MLDILKTLSTWNDGIHTRLSKLVTDQIIYLTHETSDSRELRSQQHTSGGVVLASPCVFQLAARLLESIRVELVAQGIFTPALALLTSDVAEYPETKPEMGERNIKRV